MILKGEGKHGPPDRAPPPNPMTLEEAKELILTILKYWLQNRVEKSTVTLGRYVPQIRPLFG
jgi:hypothetical protein